MRLCLCILLVVAPKVFCSNPKISSVENHAAENNAKPTPLLPNKMKSPVSPSVKKNQYKITSPPPKTTKTTIRLKYITTELIEEWAKDIAHPFVETEECLVRPADLLKSFANIKPAIRNGTAIVEESAKRLEELLESRGKAAEKIMRKAEALAKKKIVTPVGYQFLDSIDLDKSKPVVTPTEDPYEMAMDCRSPYKARLQNSSHFNAFVNMDMTSVHMSAEVFYCDKNLLQDLYWSEDLFDTFRENYAQDAMLDFQYFCSAKGFLRHYPDVLFHPAASWESLFNLHLDISSDSDVYDCRMRSWYVSSSGAPRDVLLLLDASGSMSNSSKQVIAEKFILAMLSALTDDDQVNVLRYNVVVESPVDCFNDRLVPANHENTAAMMAAMEGFETLNQSLIVKTLEYAVELLKKQHDDPERPSSCQQVIILITDSLYENFTEQMRKLDPEGEIRLFVLWLHDPFGLRDSTRKYGESLSCAQDGHFAELLTHADVTEQVMRILRVLERPLVSQRSQRLRVFSDVYAHVEDPRRSEYYWVQKENMEQAYRYQQLRKNKEKLLNGTVPMQNYLRLLGIIKNGQYYEGETVNYRLQISVGVPVFDYITSENITIKLDEERQRNSTRTEPGIDGGNVKFTIYMLVKSYQAVLKPTLIVQQYPVNRLLGVAGVDIPIDHLKLYLPYHKLGAGGTFMLVDHRGNVVIHENMKPVFDGDLLKPGYRTVDFLDIEQSAEPHPLREYPAKWLEFRKALIVNKERGNRTMFAKQIFENGMRAILEKREYYWKRILDHYTLVAALPTYNKRYPATSGAFTRDLAEEALAALSRTDFAIHPEWLYCRHVDPHFDHRNYELLYFIRRRRDDPNFPMKSLNHSFSPIPPTIVEKTYLCDEELMARLCRDAVATQQWAEQREDPDKERECCQGTLGSVTAFLATESGLTRWQQHHATGAEAPPVEADAWPGAATEPWFRRARARPRRLLLHAPANPANYLRNSDAAVPPAGTRALWYTAARTLGDANQGIIGVAGFHFYPSHLDKILKSITYDLMESRCSDEDENDCEPRCDGIIWACVIIDDGGWILSRTRSEDEPDTYIVEGPREHLATYHPAAMDALLRAEVFKLHWIHDYQAVCFPDKSSASLLPSILRSIWRTANFLMLAARELITIFAFLYCSTPINAETEKDKRKRRGKLFRDYEREKYDALYDERVLVNRTTYAACDRSRAIYELQYDEASMKALVQDVKLCSWPLKATFIPDTNAVLLAVYRDCPYKGRPIPNPLNNIQEHEVNPDPAKAASELACSRNKNPPPDRVIHTQCFPHDYNKEEGYRQCGPWLPDPEPEEV